MPHPSQTMTSVSSSNIGGTINNNTNFLTYENSTAGIRIQYLLIGRSKKILIVQLTVTFSPTNRDGNCVDYLSLTVSKEVLKYQNLDLSNYLKYAVNIC